MTREEFNGQKWSAGTKIRFRDIRHMQGVWGEVTGVDFSGTVSVRSSGRISFVRYENIMEVAG